MTQTEDSSGGNRRHPQAGRTMQKWSDRPTEASGNGLGVAAGIDGKIAADKGTTGKIKSMTNTEVDGGRGQPQDASSNQEKTKAPDRHGPLFSQTWPTPKELMTVNRGVASGAKVPSLLMS